MRFIVPAFLSLVLVFHALPMPAAAQTGAAISGRVTRAADGTPMGGVSVSVYDNYGAMPASRRRPRMELTRPRCTPGHRAYYLKATGPTGYVTRSTPANCGPVCPLHRRDRCRRRRRTDIVRHRLLARARGRDRRAGRRRVSGAPIAYRFVRVYRRGVAGRLSPRRPPGPTGRMQSPLRLRREVTTGRR